MYIYIDGYLSHQKMCYRSSLSQMVCGTLTHFGTSVQHPVLRWVPCAPNWHQNFGHYLPNNMVDIMSMSVGLGMLQGGLWEKSTVHPWKINYQGVILLKNEMH